MKKRYFKGIEIEQGIFNSFLNHHPKMKKFFDEDEPITMRICLKLFAGLLHAIISQDETNDNVIKITTELDSILNGKVSEKKILKLSDDQFNNIFTNKDKADLIKRICLDIVSKKLKLKKLVRLSSDVIIERLLQYPYITKATIKEFLIFTCGKNDIFWEENKDFILGLLKYSNIRNWTLQDINNIKKEYKGEETLFSICMIKLRYKGANHEK